MVVVDTKPNHNVLLPDKTRFGRLRPLLPASAATRLTI